MKLNNLKNLFFFIMLMSILFNISTLSWLNIWISLEINSMCFIPLMMNSILKKNSKSMILYFLIQSISSMNFLFFFIFFYLNYSNMIEMKLIITFILLMKMGSAPMYFWFPKIIKNINWMSNFLLLTWQKIIPMILLKYFFEPYLFFFSIIMNIFVSSINAMNQTNMKIIMAYSSINHMGWMMMSLLMNLNIWLIYFLHYLLINYILCKNFYFFNINLFLNIFYLKMKPFMKIMFMMNFMSLAGLPPFLGFLTKWLVIYNMLNNNYYFMMMLLLMSTLINIFFYIRLTTTSIIISYSQFKWMLYYLKYNNYMMKLIYLIYIIYFFILMLSFMIF